MLGNEERPERRTALISRELESYKIDIAALQETRFSDQGQLKEKPHTYCWSGKPSGGRREAGVAFAISNHLVKELESLPTGKNDRLISLRMRLKSYSIDHWTACSPRLLQLISMQEWEKITKHGHKHWGSSEEGK